jgi:integral membrane sensor domain MASE1
VKNQAAFATEIVALAASYVLAARAGLQIDAVGGFATLVWPPTGIALAALLIRGKSSGPVSPWGALPPMF